MSMLEFIVFSVFASITLAPTNIVSAVKSDQNEAVGPSTSSSNPHYY